MPFRQQTSEKNGPENIFTGLSPILVISRFDDGHFPNQKNVCLPVVFLKNLMLAPS